MPDPAESQSITSGELFRAAVAGEMELTRMEYSKRDGYYSVDRHPLFDVLRAALKEGK